MARILIISRSARTDDHFALMAKELLTRGHDVRVVNGIYAPHITRIESANWARFPADRIIDFPKYVMKSVAECDPTQEEISQIESEIDLTQWAAASSYLLYRRLYLDQGHSWPPYFETEGEIRNEYVATARLWRDDLSKWKPELAFSETYDLISTMVLLGYLRRAGVFFLTLAFVPLLGDGKVHFVQGTNRKSIAFEHFYKNPALVSPSNLLAANALLASLKEGNLKRLEYVEFHSKKSGRRSVIQLTTGIKKLFRKQALKNPLGHLKALINWLWLERHQLKVMPRQPYLLYFMQRQPEASTTSAASFWVDQDRVLEQLAIHAPAGLTIAVKENPRSYLFRGRRYWKHLVRLPNIALLHPSMSGELLIRNATAVVTINGSVGLEASAYGKRVGLLGKPYYDMYSGFRRLERPQDIFKYLRDPTWRPEELFDERRRWLAAFIEAAVDFGAPKIQGSIWPIAEDGGVKLADGIERHINLIRSANLDPNQFDSGEHWRYPLANSMQNS